MVSEVVTLYLKGSNIMLPDIENGCDSHCSVLIELHRDSAGASKSQTSSG